LTLEKDGAVAEVYLYGATVTKYKTASGKDLIWVSSTAKLDGTKAIRGGIPLVFPQFGAPIKEMAQHGFARNNKWTYVGTKDEPGFTAIVLTLTNEQATHEAWKFPYKLTFTVKVGATKLITDYCVENTGPEAFPFQSLQHTYLAVGDISQTTVAGLKGERFLDKTAADPTVLVTETRESADLKEFTDRVYVGKGGEILVQCPTGKILVKGTASRPDLDNMVVTSDTVMWNPWDEKAKGMNDFDDEGYKNMLCIEPGLVSGFHSLPPKASMCLQQWLELVE
jgi:glucose-6-phosphate 1-epimerase